MREGERVGGGCVSERRSRRKDDQRERERDRREAGSGGAAGGERKLLKRRERREGNRERSRRLHAMLAAIVDFLLQLGEDCTVSLFQTRRRRLRIPRRWFWGWRCRSVAEESGNGEYEKANGRFLATVGKQLGSGGQERTRAQACLGGVGRSQRRISRLELPERAVR